MVTPMADADLLNSEQILEGDREDIISKDSQPMPTSYGYVEHSVTDDRH